MLFSVLLDRCKQQILFTAVIVMLVGCRDCPTSYHYSQPPDLQDGLTIGRAESVGMDSSKLIRAVNDISCGEFNEIHALLIYKEGQLVLEEYFSGFRYQWDAPNYQGDYVSFRRDMLHPTMSVTKSFASACVGLAIKHGYISNVEESIFNYLPNHQAYKTDGKDKITIEHLLTMTSGLAWSEWSAAHGTVANDVDRLYLVCSDDPLKCVLERPLAHSPGEVFNYNGGGIVILGEIVKNASGIPLGEFAKKYLFEPLVIDSVFWFQYNNGVFATDGSLYMKPRDMLKFGVLYLNNGRWQGEQLLPEHWVEKSSAIYRSNRGIKIPIEDSGSNGYGYTWWTSELPFKGQKVEMFRANGWGGQTIMVFPELDMVIVTTGGNYAGQSKLFKLLKTHLLPALE